MFNPDAEKAVPVIPPEVFNEIEKNKIKQEWMEINSSVIEPLTNKQIVTLQSFVSYLATKYPQYRPKLRGATVKPIIEPLLAGYKNALEEAKSIVANKDPVDIGELESMMDEKNKEYLPGIVEIVGNIKDIKNLTKINVVKPILPELEPALPKIEIIEKEK